MKYAYIHRTGKRCDFLPKGKGSYHAIVEVLGREAANTLLGLDANTNPIVISQYRFEKAHAAEVATLSNKKTGEHVGSILRK